MKYDPHEYQTYATEFIKSHPVSAVLLDMGLGKTAITLTAINDLMFDRFEVHKVLVIAPKRVATFSWPDEIRKWDHLRHLRFAAAVGSADERIAALTSDADIYLIEENRKGYAHFILTGEDLPDEGGEKPKTKKLYRVTITETRKRTVTEEAESAEAAERQVQEDWEECAYLLDKSVFSGATFHAEPAEEE